MKKRFRAGDPVRVGNGTGKFPIPLRYAGRYGTVLNSRRAGNQRIYEIDFGSRRATPLEVTQGQLTAE